jgi:F-type H+-transporting ATPase subunit alpha
MSDFGSALGNRSIKSMKRVAGTSNSIRLVPELEAFSKFGSDLDAATLAVLDKGAKMLKS